MSKTKAYISGMIDNDPDYVQKFQEAEDICVNAFDEVVNPVRLDKVEIWSRNPVWIDYIVRDIELLWEDGFTHIVMLEDWMLSEGANIERFVAIKKGIEVVHIKDICTFCNQIETHKMSCPRPKYGYCPECETVHKQGECK